MKLKGSVKKGKQEPRDHHQTQHSPNSLALFATDSLELKLAYTVINEHTNTQSDLDIFLHMKKSKVLFCPFSDHTLPMSK